MQNIKGKQLENLYKTSAYTIIGCGGSLDEWVNGYNEMLAMFRLRMGDKWFDDLIDNSKPQGEDDYEE